MAGVRRSWTRPLAVAMLCGFMSMGQVVAAQAVPAESGASGAGGSLAGKLTDLHSAPLDGATVVLRNEATGAEARATTARNGTYRFTGLDSGEYTLEADSAQLGTGRVEGIFVSAGHEARVQTAIQFELSLPNPIQIASHDVQPVTPEDKVPVPAEAMQKISLPPQPLPALTRPMPETAAPSLIAILAPEPLQALPLAGRALGLEHASALADAARVAQVAIQLRQLQLRLGRQDSLCGSSA